MWHGRNKFSNVPTAYAGKGYQSRKEAAYAQELDVRVKCGELKGWQRQVTVPLKVNGRKVCGYIVDFVATYADGHEQYIEVKGYPAPLGELKIKLFRACYPDRELVVIR